MESRLPGAQLLETALSRTDWLPAALVERFGGERGDRLSDDWRARLAELVALPSPFVDPREQAYEAEAILPVVALYQTLMADGLSAEDAQTEIRRLYTRRLRERRVVTLSSLRRLPLYRQWARRAVQRQLEAAFPAPVYSLATVEDNADTLTVEVKRCPCATALAAYGMSELQPVFCRMDEVRFDVLARAADYRHIQTSDGTTCRFQFTLAPDEQTLHAAEEDLVF